VTLSTILAQDRRLVILRALAEDDDRRVNEFVLKRMLAHVGHSVSRDVLRADIAWLQDQRLVALDRLPDGAGGETQVVRLTEDGEDVAGGRAHPGVARPAPR